MTELNHRIGRADNLSEVFQLHVRCLGEIPGEFSGLLGRHPESTRPLDVNLNAEIIVGLDGEKPTILSIRRLCDDLDIAQQKNSRDCSVRGIGRRNLYTEIADERVFFHRNGFYQTAVMK
jgi:hypothetical protein